MSRLHGVVALLLTTILPAYSWHDGTGWLAWTMFSRSQMYRLHVTVTDRAGVAHPINPTQLAALSSGDAIAFLSGTDHWRHATTGEAFRSNLPGLARLACQCAPDAAVATVTFEMRKDLDTAPSSAHATVHCP
jgi:hypothetical protein